MMDDESGTSCRGWNASSVDKFQPQPHHTPNLPYKRVALQLCHMVEPLNVSHEVSTSTATLWSWRTADRDY